LGRIGKKMAEESGDNGNNVFDYCREKEEEKTVKECTNHIKRK
jgi:hypothetical protein